MKTRNAVRLETARKGVPIGSVDLDTASTFQSLSPPNDKQAKMNDSKKSKAAVVKIAAKSFKKEVKSLEPVIPTVSRTITRSMTAKLKTHDKKEKSLRKKKQALKKTLNLTQ